MGRRTGSTTSDEGVADPPHRVVARDFEEAEDYPGEDDERIDEEQLADKGHPVSGGRFR